MTHAELKFSYRCPAKCIKRRCFESNSGHIFHYVEAERNSIKDAHWGPDWNTALKVQRALWLLGIKSVTA